MDGQPIENGAVCIDDNLVMDVLPASELRSRDRGPIIDLDGMVLMPGLINAHCHLDYSTMRNAISPPKSFTAWVRRINAVKRSLTSEDYLEAIARGFAELEKWGTTTVCNVEAFPELMPLLPEPPLRTWWFYEMIDIRHRITTEDVVVGALSFFERRGNSLNHFGLSPHAPYTASQNLYGLANACADTLLMLLTTHVAESREEREMFRGKRGPLYEFMRDLGRPMDDCDGEMPFTQLWENGSINENWLLVHMNELGEKDFALLEGLPPGRQPNIVHCPGSHAYFGHTPFPYTRLAAAGANICLGTDSLASTQSLSLFDEMREFWKNEPDLTAEEVLRTTTTNPARALHEGQGLGRIRPGYLADLIALPIEAGVETVYEEVVNYRKPVPWTMIDGKIRSH